MFSFRFLGRKLCRYSQATIDVKFSQALDPSNHKIRSLDPKVVVIAPKEVYGIVKVVEGRSYREVSIPVIIDVRY
ncbi:hypothetical protein A1O3_03863 [Capronia epimyces CBS 606.96]|uniref:Uncharacterized protein n=1 Tax=Capronia epimyces CBS 606.96 TaxID=1182542 RepID=W9YXA0_9EURO|nr:uncharacterized protein A1O3_03863 [Capronia epimyces CBS 606.96]EXJ86909.1 hypothetical protein A1O3_03863 [Capronia epimyces CBS 606.96]